MKRRVVDYVKLKNHMDLTINNSALVGLRRQNRILRIFIKSSLFLGFGSFIIYSQMNDIENTLTIEKKNLLKQLQNTEKHKKSFIKGHLLAKDEYKNDKDFVLKENDSEVTFYRNKLINHWASGAVLETCCGSFINSKFYDREKVKSIIALDWINEMIDLALSINNNEIVKFDKMDCSNLDYLDNTFDTVVDTFGLQASYDHVKQYKEMKRVCKIGGKIILLEMGESFWKYINYSIIKSANKELNERGQVLFRNYDELVQNDNQVKIIKKKRKMNGRLYCYVLEKIK